MVRSNAPIGSAKSYVCLGPGWSRAANTPFRRHKTWVHEGGIATPLIVYWPHGIKAKGELRTQAVGDVIDFVPTVLDLAGGTLESQTATPPYPGVSLRKTFNADVPVERTRYGGCMKVTGQFASTIGSLSPLEMKPGNCTIWQLSRGKPRPCFKVS